MNTKKNYIIVSSFALLIVSVLGFAVYTNFITSRNAPTTEHSVSSNTSLSPITPSSNSTLSPSSDYESINPVASKPVVINGVRIEAPVESQPNSQDEAKRIQDNQFKPNQAPEVVVVKLSPTPVNNFIPVSILPPIKPPVVNQTQPTFEKARDNPPIPAPVPTPIAPQQAPIDYRYQSYRQALSRLSNNGSQVLVPIANNNIYSLSFEADADLDNVLKYDFMINTDKRGYANYGTKPHLDVLKCNTYTPNCRIVLYQANNGRYYVDLDALR
jgi:hypothetical protein